MLEGTIWIESRKQSARYACTRLIQAQLRAVNKRGSHALENAILATVQSRIANQSPSKPGQHKIQQCKQYDRHGLYMNSIDETGGNSAFVEIERF